MDANKQAKRENCEDMHVVRKTPAVYTCNSLSSKCGRTNHASSHFISHSFLSILQFPISSSKLPNPHRFRTKLNQLAFATSNFGIFTVQGVFFLPCYYINLKLIFWHILYLFCGLIFVSFVFPICRRFITSLLH